MEFEHSRGNTVGHLIFVSLPVKPRLVESCHGRLAFRVLDVESVRVNRVQQLTVKNTRCDVMFNFHQSCKILIIQSFCTGLFSGVHPGS